MEVNIDEAISSITSLLAKQVDKDTKPFGRYETKKLKITIQVNAAKINKRKSMIENMEKK